ncbi:T9SS type A sorting domain-containing protein [Polaribacter sp. SA4-12]|uniref:T9SS type A sorting domain-containing protein n=1 Tax=Polaribacter sp. SA4-12 TaxID=1312072 RepID=UPI000B3D11C3|nr:T9SS type A sorting domain-containing protein [Polaribacter sp. SA4-12]ARV14483.1 hypothetical protein BTO07_04670 [Polaribacter sp. SA4-12]
MYVDDFELIIGNTTAENILLEYAQANNIETLLLYGLHIFNANNNLSNTETNYVLANFIYKAKTIYGVISVGATAENGNFFTNTIDTYNNSRSDPLEKFDIYNLEFEYWSNYATGPGGYYCNTYLTPNNLPCTIEGAFEFYISVLQTIKNLAINNSHPITTEAYVGWPTETEASTIGANLDRVRIHAYVSNPNSAFSYLENRLIDFANGNPDIDVSIIFSSEPEFMSDWLSSNSIIAAENIFIDDWRNASSIWANNINLIDFTYFTYTDLKDTDTTLSTNIQEVKEVVSVFPNPMQNTLSVRSIAPIKNIRAYDVLGKLVLETKERNINVNNLSAGIYFFQIHTEKGMKIIKTVKE